MASKVLALLLLTVLSAEARVSFRNHKVLRVPVITREQANVIGQLEQEGIDVWSMVFGREAHLRVDPFQWKIVNATLNDAGMFATVGIHDLQQLIDDEDRNIAEADRQRGRASWIGRSFVRYNEIESWIVSLPSLFPTLVKVDNIGKSYYNRNIYVIKMSNNIATSGDRKVIFTEANIHAREWLAHASIAWVIQNFLTRVGSDARITAALTKYEWHFIVVLNPDGYEYTWTTNRMWRKTVTPHGTGTCIGVDPNRNFDHYHCGEGTSNNPCSDIYCGPSAFSEKETAVLRDYTTSIKDRMVVFDSVHSYSQLLMLPYAYTLNAYPEDFSELMRVINDMAIEIYQTSRKIYTTGNVADLLNAAAGSTMDWIRDELKTKYVLAWELRPTQGATSGFIVHPSEIEPTAREVSAALLKLSETIVV